MINLISKSEGYIIIKDLVLRPFTNGILDEALLENSELKSIQNLYIRKKLELSSEDYIKVEERIKQLSFIGREDVSVVAFTGSYNDLLNKPNLVTPTGVLPIINNITLDPSIIKAEPEGTALNLLNEGFNFIASIDAQMEI